jgi:hypothetical protein
MPSSKITPSSPYPAYDYFHVEPVKMTGSYFYASKISGNLRKICFIFVKMSKCTWFFYVLMVKYINIIITKEGLYL